MLNYLLQWELTFTEVLNLGKEGVMKEENKYSSLHFDGCRFFPLSTACLQARSYKTPSSCFKKIKGSFIQRNEKIFYAPQPF